MNMWKILTILLLLVAIFLTYTMYFGNTEYNIAGVKISKKQISEIVDSTDMNEFILCDIEKDKCIRIGRVKHG